VDLGEYAKVSGGDVIGLGDRNLCCLDVINPSESSWSNISIICWAVWGKRWRKGEYNTYIHTYIHTYILIYIAPKL